MNPPVELPVKKDGEVVAHAEVSPVDGHLRDYSWHLNEGNHGDYVRRFTSSYDPEEEYPVTRGVYLHREIAGLGEDDPREVHHADGDPLNCKRHNLWVCTHELNMRAQHHGARHLLETFREENPGKGEAGYVPVGNPHRAVALVKSLILREELALGDAFQHREAMTGAD